METVTPAHRNTNGEVGFGKLLLSRGDRCSKTTLHQQPDGTQTVITTQPSADLEVRKQITRYNKTANLNANKRRL